MLYREAGQFKTSYAEDQQIFPIRQDRIAVVALLVFSFVVVPLIANQYWLAMSGTITNANTSSIATAIRSWRIGKICWSCA